MSNKKNGQVLGVAVHTQTEEVAEVQATTPQPQQAAEEQNTAILTHRPNAEERIQRVEEFKVISERYREAKAKKEELAIFAAGMEGKFVGLAITYDDKEFQIRSSKMIAEVCALIGARIEQYVDLCRREVETFNI